MQDEAIIDLYWQRNEKAIEETDKKYGRYLFQIANNILSDREDSKECVNDTYFRAWNTMPPNRPNALVVYLKKITRFVSIDKYRRRKSLKRKASDYSVAFDELRECEYSSDMIEERIDAMHLAKSIEAFLNKLPAETRNMFVLRYFYMDSVKDIARYTNTSESNVYVKLHRTRLALKEYLMKEEGINP